MSDKTIDDTTETTIAETPLLDPPTPPETEEDELDEDQLHDIMVSVAAGHVDSAVLHLTKAIPAIIGANQYTAANFAGRILANLTDLSNDLHCIIGYDFASPVLDDDDEECE